MRRYYSKAHYLRLSNGGPDKPGDAERRIRERQIGERAYREMVERFGPATAENARASCEWREQRVRELRAEVR